MDATEYVENLPERIPVGVNVSTIVGDQLKQNGIAVVTEAPELEIRFPANHLPEAGQIDRDADCLVFIETGEIVTLICTIEAVPGRDMLRVTVRDVIQHSEKREFFRGPADRLIISCSMKIPGGSDDFEAQGVNISCGGMLLVADRKPKTKEKVTLEIQIPDPVKKTLSCRATILRVSPFKDSSYFIAVRFTDVDSDICDDIMAFCFAEQRRLLREQVITRDL